METLPNAASLTVKVVKYYGDVRVFHSELKLPTQDPVTGHTAAYPSGGVAWVTAGAETSMTGRNIIIRGSGGSLDRPGPLPVHLHTVYNYGVFGAPAYPLEPPG